MGKGKLLWKEGYQKGSRYKVEIRVFEVAISTKYPQGIKAKFALVDTQESQIMVLVDNHAPFGFHIHSGLPKNKNIRVLLDTDDFLRAYEIFMNKVERIINEN